MRSALSAMCYREVAPGRWFKPVGHMLFAFDEFLGRWTNHYRSMTGTVERFESKQGPSPGEVPLRWLKDVEARTRTDVNPDSTSRFELEVTVASLLE